MKNIFSGFKLIQLPINKSGKINLPDDRTLYGKKIQAIIPMVGTYPLLNGMYDLSVYGTETINTTDLENMTINLTANGQYFFYQNSAFNMSQIATEGIYDNINTVLSIPDCFVDVQAWYGNKHKILQLAVFYEDTASINAIQNVASNYNTFEVSVGSSDSSNFGRKYYFEENRILVDKKFRNLLVSYPTVTPQGNTGINQNIEKYGYITLVRGGHILWQQMPVVLLNQLYNYRKLQFANIIFDFNNSYIELAEIQKAAPLTLPAYLTLTAEYQR